MEQLIAHLFGDYILQGDWMAQNKTKHNFPAAVHAFIYSLCFVPLIFQVQHMKLCWLVIFGTHFLIDRFRLARYVVWAKNWMGPRMWWTLLYGKDWKDLKEVRQANHMVIPEGFGGMENFRQPTPPLWACPTGYPPTTPIWLSTWLLIAADNSIHLLINYLALRYL